MGRASWRRGNKGIKREEGSRELKENKGGKNGAWNNEKQLNKETETKKFKKKLLDKRCRSAMEKQAEKTERVDWRRTKREKKRKEKKNQETKEEINTRGISENARIVQI